MMPFELPAGSLLALFFVFSTLGISFALDEGNKRKGKYTPTRRTMPCWCRCDPAKMVTGRHWIGIVRWEKARNLWVCLLSFLLADLMNLVQN
jgi:hypothetical protein